MCRYRALIALVLGALAMCGEVSAQGRSAPAASRPPGGTYRGRYIGFQPRHGRVQANRTAGPSQGQPSAVSRPPAVAAESFLTGDVSQSVFDDSSAALPVDGSMPPPPVPPTTAEAETDEIIGDPFDGSVVGPFVDGSVSDGPYHGAPSLAEWQPVAGPAIWARGDYLLWWTKGMGVPALATTSPAGTPQADAGVLGRLNTSVLFGDGNMLDESRSGGRVSLGLWLDACHQSGIEFSYLGLGEESASFHGTADQFPILARPFFDLQAGAADSRLIVFPNLVEGAIAIDVSSEFQSAEVSLRRPCHTPYWSNIDCFVGYRFAELEDSVLISESTTSLAEPTTGTRFDLDDRFESRNQFHGGQIGVRLIGHSAPGWSSEFTGKFGLGNTSSRMAISGQTVVTPTSGTPTTQSAGLLAQGTNSGVFETDEFSTLSEFGLTLHRHLGCGWSFNVGYQFLLWTDVLRAGEQIDSTINVSQIPPGTLSGEARPEFRGETTDFWAQGLSLGLEYCY